MIKLLKWWVSCTRKGNGPLNMENISNLKQDEALGEHVQTSLAEADHVANPQSQSTRFVVA